MAHRDISLQAALRSLSEDSVEKVETAATAKFAQKRSDRRLRLAMPSHSTWQAAE
jgi:hypothetical protein